MLKRPSGERLGVGDDAGASDGEHRRPPLVVRLVSRLQQHHPDDPVARERVAHHRPVARLEDVQRQKHVREEDDVRQWEERDGGREHGKVKSPQSKWT